jgi:hypothetical protein
MTMANASTITPTTLARENVHYLGTAGRSVGNRRQGFRPAFFDNDTGLVHPSRFADGRPAPVHVIDGLPPALVVARTSAGRVLEVKAGVVSGFVRDERFYTREEAMHAAEAEAFEMAA